MNAPKPDDDPKPASEFVPEILQRIVNPKPKRPDCDPKKLSEWMEFEIWEAGPKWKGPKVAPQLCAMLQAVRHFAKDMIERKQPRWLSFVGSTGGGKTYLAKHFWDWYEKCGPDIREFGKDEEGDTVYPGSWCPWTQMAGKLQRGEGYGYIDEMIPEKLVVIDDIGANRDNSGHVADCLWRLLDGRVGKWTIVTSNLTLQQIRTSINQRVSSRMFRDGNVVVEINAPDYNLRHL